MFDEIKGPQNEFAGPSTGHSTENGDSWFNAIRKINENFKKLVGAFEGRVESVIEATDKDARQRIDELEDSVSALHHRMDELEARMPGATAPIVEQRVDGDGVFMDDPVDQPEIEEGPAEKPDPAPKRMRSTTVQTAARAPVRSEFSKTDLSK